MQLGGYAGKILYVNLSDGSSREEPLDEKLARECIGGAGINNHLAANLIPPDVDPLSPASTIIIGTGPFNGTFIPGSSQTMSIYRSPLNGAYVQSNGGGCFRRLYGNFLRECDEIIHVDFLKRDLKKPLSDLRDRSFCSMDLTP